MAQSNVEAIQALYRAFLKRELMTILSLVDSGIEIRQSEMVPWGGTYKGLGGLKEFFGKLLENVDSKVDFTEWIEAGDSVVYVNDVIKGKLLAACCCSSRLRATRNSSSRTRPTCPGSS